MGGTLVVNGCSTHGEGRTNPSPVTREFGWDGDFDEGGMGAGMPGVYEAPICLVEHSVVTQLLGLYLRGGSRRVVVLAATASSQI